MLALLTPASAAAASIAAIAIGGRDKQQEGLAFKILKGHSGREVHVHDWGE